MEFEWDAAKERENIRRYKVDFVEAVLSFLDPRGFQLVDEKHSGTEARFYWVGQSPRGRILTTRFTRRGETIRIIGSAEWRKFRRLYYYETTKTE